VCNGFSIREFLSMIRWLSRFVPRGVKNRLRRIALAGLDQRLDLVQAPPWSSPNVWEAVVRTYRGKTDPALFEYGCGASSLHHLRNLLALGGGTYTGVEYNRRWFHRVCASVVEFCLTEGMDFQAWVDSRGPVQDDFQVIITDPDPEARRCTVTLKYRAPQAGFVQGEGSAEQFDRYIRAIGTDPYDLIVVDGRARRHCVNHVLDHGLLRPLGSLALFEAGRGTERWLGKPTCTADADYQPAVRRMVSLGGRMIDGVGYYTWVFPRGSLPPASNPSIPLECCLLTLEKSALPRPCSSAA
jgi:hypothetical protein